MWVVAEKSGLMFKYSMFNQNNHMEILIHDKTSQEYLLHEVTIMLTQQTKVSLPTH